MELVGKAIRDTIAAGDDLNDISQIFSDCENAVDRVILTINNIENWGFKLFH